VVRVSMVHYNTLEEVDRLIEALETVLWEIDIACIPCNYIANWYKNDRKSVAEVLEERGDR
jgi:hypothetical protein